MEKLNGTTFNYLLLEDLTEVSSLVGIKNQFYALIPLIL